MRKSSSQPASRTDSVGTADPGAPVPADGSVCVASPAPDSMREANQSRIRSLLVDEAAEFPDCDASAYSALRTLVSKTARETGKRFRIRIIDGVVRVKRIV